MQNISTALRNAINATSTHAQPRVIAEWNYNRFIDGITVTNPAGNKDDKIWPIESLISFRYTDSGIPRAIVGEARTYSKNWVTKFHTVSERDSYKYWVSPNRSTSTTSLSGCQPTVNYGRALDTNKIIIKFEVSYSRPDVVSTYTIDAAGKQTLIGTKTPDSKGVITYLYNGAWGNTINHNTAIPITGIRVVVSSMSKANVHCHMLEISARREVNLSGDVENVDISKTYEEQSRILPTGTIASNTCNINLANDHGYYNPENTSSPYYGLLDENVLMTVSLGYQVGAGMEYIKQGQFYVDSWGVSTDSVTVDVDCTDASKILQETYVPESLFQKYYVRETEKPYRVVDVIRELLARVGFSNIRFNVWNSRISIPYIWYRDEVTVWEALQDIAQAIPASFYFDEDGVFVWQDMEFLYNKMNPVHVLDYDLDLISASHEFEVSANHVTVRYNTYNINKYDGQVVYSELWSPEGDVALRVAEQKGSLTSTSTHIPLSMTSDEFATWPESGMVRIGQERIRYGAKSQIDDPDAPYYRTDIHPALMKLERGVLGTSATEHTTGISGYLAQLRMSGGKRAIVDGSLRLVAPFGNNYKGYLINQFGTLNTRERYYSTRLKFTDLAKHNIGGLTIHQSGDGAAYYFELTPTTFARQYNHGEIRMYKMDANGNITELVRTGDMRGVNAEVIKDIWYRVEVQVTDNKFNVYVNGSSVGSFTDSTYTTGQYAPYVRGHSVANFEYVMAGRSMNASRIELFQKNGTTSMDSTYANHQVAGAAGYNEFGNLVHEAREFNVEYDVYPAIGARVLNTNDLEAIVVDRVLGPFRGHFVVENHSRTTAVLSGEDAVNELGYRLSHSLLIYGMAIVRASEEVKISVDEESLRRRGRQEVEISTPWIEDEEGANRISDYIIGHWSKPVDIINVEWVPNPALQIGDLVAVNYPQKGFEGPTHHYYVIGMELSWDDGLTSSLILRRKR